MSAPTYQALSLPEKASSPELTSAGTKFLLPGELSVCTAPLKLATVIGSCVVLCLWESHKKIGGMNHYLLPDGPIDAANKYRYANNANAALLERIIRAGANIAFVVARVYGGCSAHIAAGQEENSLGNRNVCAALDFLRSTGIPLEHKDVGGQHGRKIVFDTATGKITTELL
jgi:chemotaxis protein CheD